MRQFFSQRLSRLSLEDRRRLVWAASGWLLLAIVMVIVVLSSSRERTVMNAYRLGANRWLAGEPLYDDTGHGFLYLPQAAWLMVPITALPYWWGELLWRVLSIAVFAIAIGAICRAVQPQRWLEFFPSMSLVAAALGWSAMRTGQMTVIMTALMLFCLADLVTEKWTRATVWVWLAVALKPIILPFLLLVVPLWPRSMSIRMVTGLAVTAIAPFLVQNPRYVLEQYRLFPVMLRSAQDQSHRESYTQAFSMLEALGCPISDRAQLFAQCAAGLIVLLAAMAMKRRLPIREFGMFLGAVAASYILLLNPRTESNTYLLIGPFLGYYMAACGSRRQWKDAAFLLVAAGLTLGNYELGKQFFAGRGIQVLAPIATIAFVVWLVAKACRSNAPGGPESKTLL